MNPVQIAYENALKRAAFSSKPLTRSEKQAAIRRLITDRPNASDREIARMVGVDHKTVGRIRMGETTQQTASWPRIPSPEAVAKRLFRAFEKTYEARGLGIADWFTGDRTGERLAGVLGDVYGEQA